MPWIDLLPKAKLKNKSMKRFLIMLSIVVLISSSYSTQASTYVFYEYFDNDFREWTVSGEDWSDIFDGNGIVRNVTGEFEIVDGELVSEGFYQNDHFNVLTTTNPMDTSTSGAWSFDVLIEDKERANWGFELTFDQHDVIDRELSSIDADIYRLYSNGTHNTVRAGYSDSLVAIYPYDYPENEWIHFDIVYLDTEFRIFIDNTPLPHISEESGEINEFTLYAIKGGTIKFDTVLISNSPEAIISEIINDGGIQPETTDPNAGQYQLPYPLIGAVIAVPLLASGYFIITKKNHYETYIAK